MVSDPDQSNEISVLDGGDESVSPDFLHIILKDWVYNYKYSILIVHYLDNAQSHTSKA